MKKTDIKYWAVYLDNGGFDGFNQIYAKFENKIDAEKCLEYLMTVHKFFKDKSEFCRDAIDDEKYQNHIELFYRTCYKNMYDFDREPFIKYIEDEYEILESYIEFEGLTQTKELNNQINKFIEDLKNLN